MNLDLRSQLLAFKNGELDLDQILSTIAKQPFEEFSIGRIDHLRQYRTALPEVILADGKDPSQVLELFDQYQQRNQQIFATRCSLDVANALQASGKFHFFDTARICSTFPPGHQSPHYDARVAVVSAGNLDRHVAEEAVVTAQLYGLQATRVYDVGVAGLNRLLPEVDTLRSHDVVIVVAGMDGALPSVLAGLLDVPIIAVPTSVGYGASFFGLSALLAMLNACSGGVVVCNIDNGFGAASHALKIAARMQHRCNSQSTSH